MIASEDSRARRLLAIRQDRNTYDSYAWPGRRSPFKLWCADGKTRHWAFGLTRGNLRCYAHNLYRSESAFDGVELFVRWRGGSRRWVLIRSGVQGAHD
jgi:hypothetical protein